jgi:GT2 family glycosyltransferase
VGIAGSRLEAQDGSVHVSAFRFFTPMSEFDRGMRLGLVSRVLSRWRINPPPPKENTEAQWVSGASMIIRRAVIDAIGPLDEGYFTYFDDVDYCLNARRAGWSSWYVPASRVIHFEGASTGIAGGRPTPQKRRASYWYEARRRYYLKNYGPLRAALVDAAYITGLALFRVRQFIQRKPDNDPPYFLRDIIRHSVFFAGTKVKDVPNPALAEPHAPPPGAAPPNPAST